MDIPNQEKYRALSYEWGRPDAAMYTILVDNKSLPVRSKLYNFLEVYRKKQHTWQRVIPLWIDAICINQNDINEQNHQVGMMRDVYARAHEVLLWLGQCEDSQSHCFSLLEPLAAGFRWFNDASTLAMFFDAVLDINIRPLAPAIASLFGRMFLSVQTRTGVEKLLINSYFQRTWVYPEMGLARRKRVLWGRKKISWYTLRTMVQYEDYRGRPGRLAASAVLDLPEPNRRLVVEEQLDSQLLGMQGTSCERPHDRVYAILSICPNRTEFPIDYDSSLLELLLRVSLFCLAWKSAVGHYRITDLQYTALSMNMLAWRWRIDQHGNADLTSRPPRDPGLPLDIDFNLTTRQPRSIMIPFAEVHTVDNPESFTPLFNCLPEDLNKSWDESLDAEIQQKLYEALKSDTEYIIPHDPGHVRSPILLFTLTRDFDSSSVQVYRVRRRVSISGQNVETPNSDHRFVTINIEDYGEQGLPGATFSETTTFMEEEESDGMIQAMQFRFQDLRPVVLLTTFSEYQEVRRAVLDLLYHPTSFCLDSVAFTRDIVGARLEETRRDFCEPPILTWTSPDSAASSSASEPVLRIGRWNF